MARLQFWEKKCFYITLERVQRGFLSERKGKVMPCRWTKNEKGAGTSSGESGAQNLEAESIRSRAGSTGGRVKLKTIIEIRQQSGEYGRVCKVEDSHRDKIAERRVREGV